MPMNEVYITKTSMFLPNDPVPVEDMELYLGYINGKPSKSKKIVLRSNGIKTRYYALNKEGKATHTNAEMTAEAIRELYGNDPAALKQIELLCCGTSSPDQMMPSHGVMVHGELPEMRSVEVVSPSGVCCAGMHAFKYAYMAVKTGEVHEAVATGSERFSGSLVANVFDEEAHHLEALNLNPFISFDKEFLRWMLSDGAAAFALNDQPNAEGLSLRIDWIEGVSFANEMETCMYMAGEKENGILKGYLDFSPEEAIEKSLFSIKQDISILSKNIVPLGGQNYAGDCRRRRGFNVSDVDYFLPLSSSEFFRNKIFENYGEEQSNHSLRKVVCKPDPVGKCRRRFGLFYGS